MNIHEIVRNTQMLQLEDQNDYFRRFIKEFPELKSDNTGRIFRIEGTVSIGGSWRIIIRRLDTGSTFNETIVELERKLRVKTWIPIDKMPRKKLEF